MKRKVVINIDKDGYGHVNDNNCKRLWGTEIEIRNYNFKKFDNKISKKDIRIDSKGNEYVATYAEYHSPTEIGGNTILIDNSGHIKRVLDKPIKKPDKESESFNPF